MIYACLVVLALTRIIVVIVLQESAVQAAKKNVERGDCNPNVDTGLHAFKTKLNAILSLL